MKKYLRILPFFFVNLLFISMVGYSQTISPFYSETFSSAADFTAKWVSGGTNAGPEKWKWSDNPKSLFEGQPVFTSKTAANGFAVFNSEDETASDRHFKP